MPNITSIIDKSAILRTSDSTCYLSVDPRNPLMRQSDIRIVAAIATKGHILSNVTTL